MSCLVKALAGAGSAQERGVSSQHWNGAATGINGTTAILVGRSWGAWVDASEVNGWNFVAIELDADGATLWEYQVRAKSLSCALAIQVGGWAAH